MNLEELLEFIKKEHQRLLKFYHLKDKNKLRYPMTVKIMEEVGELAEEILALNSIQRVEKLNSRKAKVSDKVADVIITTMLLGENLGIDIKKELKKALGKRKSRTY